MGTNHSNYFYDVDILYNTNDSEKGLEKIYAYFRNGAKLGVIFAVPDVMGYSGAAEQGLARMIHRFGFIWANTVAMAVILPTVVVLTSKIRGGKSDQINHFFGGAACISPMILYRGAWLGTGVMGIFGIGAMCVKDYKMATNCAPVWKGEWLTENRKSGDYFLRNEKLDMGQRFTKYHPKEPTDY